jgi:hypothetical protein
MSGNVSQYYDSVAAAYQLGRLDLVTLLLTVVLLLIALAAIPGFFYFKYRAEKAARDEVSERMAEFQQGLETQAISKMEAMLPTLFDSYMEIVKNSVTSQEANDIAGAQDEEANADHIPSNQGGTETGK